MLHVSCSRVRGREKIQRFRSGEISRKLVRCRNGGEEECCACCVEECGKDWEKGRGKGNGET